jgi:hypothetical protein
MPPQLLPLLFPNIFGLMQEGTHDRLQRWELVLSNFPNNIQINSHVVMNEHIS